MALDTDVTVALISAATTIIIVLISCCRGGKGADTVDEKKAPLLPSPPANADDPELGLETPDCPEHKHKTEIRPNDPTTPTSPWDKVTAAAAVIGAALIGAAVFLPWKERRANHEVEAPARPLDQEPSNVEDLSRNALKSQNGVRKDTMVLIYTSEETSTMVEQSRQDSHSAPPTPRGLKQNHNNNGVLVEEMDNDEEETVGPREQVQ